MISRNAVDRGLTAIADLTAWRLDGRDGRLSAIFHKDPDVRLALGGFDEAAFDRERGDRRQHVAAILRTGNESAVDEDLKEQIVDIDAGTIRRLYYGRFAGQRIAAAHAVYLAHIGRAHYAQQEGIAFALVGRQVAGEKDAALRCSAPHPHDRRRRDHLYSSPASASRVRMSYMSRPSSPLASLRRFSPSAASRDRAF